MSHKVAALVRSRRLPAGMKKRPLVKAVLLVLADRCHDDGSTAWPSEHTIGQETEIGEKNVTWCLLALWKAGLIEEQERPRQRKPRTWRLRLDRLAALPEVEKPATHQPSAPHTGAELKSRSAPHTGAELAKQTPTSQLRTFEPQLRTFEGLAPHTGADDPYEPMNHEEERADERRGSGHFEKDDLTASQVVAAARRGTTGTNHQPTVATIPISQGPVPAAAAQPHVSAAEKSQHPIGPGAIAADTRSQLEREYDGLPAEIREGLERAAAAELRHMVLLTPDARRERVRGLGLMQLQDRKVRLSCGLPELTATTPRDMVNSR